jgi:ATP-binding cassette subfamily F protein 3
MTSRIVATSRQTRFNPLVQGDASEVDLNDVNIAIGEREILVDARIRLKSGVKYGLIGRWVFFSRTIYPYPVSMGQSSLQGEDRESGNGVDDRNGCGKSTVLQALADRLIPGIPPSLRIHIVSQVDTEPAPDEEKKEAASAQTALQRVLDGHVERRKALKERAGTTF